MDDRWRRHLDNLSVRLTLAGLPELRIEAVAAYVGRAQTAVIVRVPVL